MNRKNLELLANYLESLPENYEHFHMGCYLENNEYLGVDIDDIVANNININDCGTVGCAIGHLPFVEGIPEPNINVDNGWEDYSKRVIGIDCYSDCNKWSWCFNAEWLYVDNTPQGTAKRIKWLLENGLPEDWVEQMKGKVKLCYKD